MCGLSLANERVLTAINSKNTKARFKVFLLIQELVPITPIRSVQNQSQINDKYVWQESKMRKKNLTISNNVVRPLISRFYTGFWVLSIHKREMLSSILFIHYLEENFCLVSDYFLSHGIDRNEVIERSVSKKEGHCCFNERVFFGVPVTT